MSDYTRVGNSLWEWEPFQKLGLAAQMVYLRIYCSPVVKRSCPGLFSGDIPALVRITRMTLDDTVNGLDELIATGLVEYDRLHHVMRLTAMPDCWERPDNANVLKGMWNGFKTVPACGVRDAHVALLRQLVDGSPKGVPESMEDVWATTFATVAEKASRKRGVRSVSKQTHGTVAQADLFGSAVLPDVETVSETVPVTVPRTVGDLGSGSQGSGISDPPVRAYPPQLAKGTETELPLAQVIQHPGAMPFTVAQLLGTLESTSGGRFAVGVFDRRLAAPITALIRQMAGLKLGLEAAAEVGRWLAGGGMAWREGVVGPDWVATTGKFLDALNQARHAHPAPAAKSGGSRRPEPSPPSSFSKGWRKLKP